MSTDKNNIIPADASELPPGARLRRLRSERGLQPEQVCAYLGITRHRLQVLEDDDYCRLPAEVYVRGWIRRYCVLLELPAEPLLNAFEEQSQRLKDEKQQRCHQRERARRQRHQRVAGVAGVCALVVMALGWWVQSGAPDAESAAPMVAEIEDRPVATMPRELLGGSRGEKPAQLEVRFSADSWVEVLDSAGNILVADLKLADEVLVLEGIPPFEVYVANAPGVQLRYRGELLELAMSPNDKGVRTLIGDHAAASITSFDDT